MRKNLAAVTGASHPYPPFVSINHENDKVDIIVRGSAQGEREGRTASVILDAKDARALLRQALDRLDETYPSDATECAGSSQ